MQTPTGAGKQRTKGVSWPKSEGMLDGFCNCISYSCTLFIIGWWMLYCAFKAYLALDVLSGISDDNWVTAACMTVDGTMSYDECCLGHVDHPFNGSNNIALLRVNCDVVETVYIIALVDSFC